MTKTLIVPGLDGSPAPHWQHWWAQTDPNALLVEQESWSRPTPEAWETQVAGAVLAHPGAILVGHSLGAVVIARLLTKWPQLNVAGALLVAPADPGQSGRLSAFAPLPRGRFDVPAILVASRNDPWMSFAQAGRLARQWGAALYDIGAAGHINVDAGFGPWPGALALRDRLRAAAAQNHAVPARSGAAASRYAFY